MIAGEVRNMAIEIHARFIEDAQKAGHMDTSAARDLLKLYKSYQGQGLLRGIEQVAVEHGFLTSNQVREIQSHRDDMNVTQVGPFTIIKKLGSGGMAEVYKAQDNRTGKVIALKVLHSRLASDEGYLSRFYREAQAAAKLNHPNIIQAYEAARTLDGKHYLSMEFVEGTTLKAWLNKTKVIPERESVKMGIQVAKALEHAQSQNIVHRDIKPDNIMVTKDGRVKLTDLGLAKQGDDNRIAEIGVAVGTPQYIAPEQARGDGVIDIRCDIYSLGATLYHASTGRPPFEGNSAAIIMVKHLNETPRWPLDYNPALSEATAHVIMKMLAKAPSDRYQTPKDLLRDMSAIYHGLKGAGSATISAVQPKGARSAVLAAAQASQSGIMTGHAKSSINIAKENLPSESGMASFKTMVRTARITARHGQSKFIFLGVCITLVSCLTIFTIMMPSWPHVMASAIGLAKPPSESEDDSYQPIRRAENGNSSKKTIASNKTPLKTQTESPKEEPVEITPVPAEKPWENGPQNPEIQTILQQVNEFVEKQQFIAAHTLLAELKAKQKSDSKGGFSETHILLDKEMKRVRDASRPYFMADIDEARKAYSAGNSDSAQVALASARKLLSMHEGGAYALEFSMLEKQIKEGKPAAPSNAEENQESFDGIYEHYSKITNMVLRKDYDQALHFLDTLKGVNRAEVELWKHGIRSIDEIFKNADANARSLIGFTHRVGPVSGKVSDVKDGKIYINTKGVEIARPLTELTENQQLELAGIAIGSRDPETQAQLAILAFFRGQKSIAQARFEEGKKSSKLIAKLHESLERMNSIVREKDAEKLVQDVVKLVGEQRWRDIRSTLDEINEKYADTKAVAAAQKTLNEFEQKMQEGTLQGALVGDARLDGDNLDVEYSFKKSQELTDWWYTGDLKAEPSGLDIRGDFWLGYRVSYDQINKLEIHFRVDRFLNPERAFLAWGVHAAAQVHLPSSLENDLPRGYFGFFKSLQSGLDSTMWSGGEKQQMIVSSNKSSLKPATDYVLAITRTGSNIAWSINGEVFLKASDLKSRPGPRLVLIGSQAVLKIKKIRVQGEIRSSWLKEAKAAGSYLAEELPKVKSQFASGERINLLNEGMPKIWSEAPDEWSTKNGLSRWSNYFRAPSMRLMFPVKNGLLEGSFQYTQKETQRGFEFSFRDTGDTRYALRFEPSKPQIALIRYLWNDGLEKAEILGESTGALFKPDMPLSFRLAFKDSRIQVIFNKNPVITYNDAKADTGDISLDSVYPGRNSVYYFSSLQLQNLR